MNLIDLDRAILSDVWTSPSLWDSLTYLCDNCNGRLTGTQDELKAGDYLLEKFREIGLQNVRAETFDMPGWVRGETCLTILDGSNPRVLFCLALVGSPAGEVEAEIIDLESGKDSDFERLEGKIAGNILLTGPEGPHRLEKYVKAQAGGAAAILIAQGQPGMTVSAGSLGLRSVEPTLPILGLPYEATTYLRRHLKKGLVKARLVFKGGRHPGTARNISAELPGVDPAQGWVIACGHYDGHDIGQAAQDNATGTAVVLEAARLLAPFQKELKAGIRFVLFAGEEEGIYGSPAYVAAHSADWDSIRLVYNADIVGCAAPLMLRTQNSPELAAYLKQLPLADLGAVVDDSDFINNSDHFSFSAVGIASLWAVTSAAPEGKYWVHTPSDTLDKLDLTAVREAAATTARVLVRMALEPEKLPQGRKSAEEMKQVILAKGWEKLLRMQNRCPF
jgi:aminopeptidase YwaD